MLPVGKASHAYRGLAETADLLVSDHRDSFPEQEPDGIRLFTSRGILIVVSEVEARSSNCRRGEF
jgi:hypothetical protein